MNGKCVAERSRQNMPIFIHRGSPLIVPGERISEKIAEEMSEYEKMGFRIEGTKVKGKIEVLING